LSFVLELAWSDWQSRVVSSLTLLELGPIEGLATDFTAAALAAPSCSNLIVSSSTYRRFRWGPFQGP
jgi:hypothetical protein